MGSTVGGPEDFQIKLCLLLGINLVSFDHDNVGDPENKVEHQEDHHHQDVSQFVPNLAALFHFPLTD